MKSEVIKERLEKSKGKKADIFLDNGFRYYGTITNCDDVYVEILASGKYKLIPLSDIHDATIYDRETKQ